MNGATTFTLNFSDVPGLGALTYSWKECYTGLVGTGTSVTVTLAAHDMAVYKIVAGDPTTTSTKTSSTSSKSSTVVSTTKTSSTTSTTKSSMTVSSTRTSTTSLKTSSSVPTSTSTGGTLPKWSQCAGLTWTGSGTCKFSSCSGGCIVLILKVFLEPPASTRMIITLSVCKARWDKVHFASSCVEPKHQHWEFLGQAGWMGK